MLAPPRPPLGLFPLPRDGYEHCQFALQALPIARDLGCHTNPNIYDRSRVAEPRKSERIIFQVLLNAGPPRDMLGFGPAPVLAGAHQQSKLLTFAYEVDQRPHQHPLASAIVRIFRASLC
jgi:hypothetical protein